MIQMSERYNDTITNQNISRRVISRVAISLGDAYVDNRLHITSSPVQPTSNLAQLNDGELYPDYQYIALDGSWTIGDDKRLSSEIYMQTGYRGWTVCNASGIFPAKEFFQLRFDTPKMIDQVDISFDPLLNEYAVNFTLRFYSDENGANIIDTWTITNNPYTMRLVTAESMGKEPVAGVKLMEFEIQKWSRGNTYAKVTECFGAREEGFSDQNRIISMNITYQSDSIGSVDVGSVNAAVATIVMDNSDRYFSRTDPYDGPYIRNKLMSISLGLEYEDGEIEECPMGVFFVENLRQDPNNLTVTITAQDIIREFGNRKYKRSPGLNYPASIAQIFEDVVIASGLPIRYKADSVCAGYIVPVEPTWPDGIDCRQMLKHLAQTVNGRAYQNRDGTVVLSATIGATPEPIDIFTDPVQDIGPNVYFDISGRSSNIEGVTRVSITGADGSVTTSSDEDGERLVGINEYQIQNNPIFKAYPATDTSLHKVVANNILASYGYQTELRNFNWRANPALEVGDIIRVLTMDGVFLLARVTQYSLHYSGGLKGSIFARAIPGGISIPDIQFFIEDGELKYYVDDLHSAFFSAEVDYNGDLVINHSGPLSNAEFRIEDGYLLMDL